MVNIVNMINLVSNMVSNINKMVNMVFNVNKTKKKIDCLNFLNGFYFK